MHRRNFRTSAEILNLLSPKSLLIPTGKRNWVVGSRTLYGVRGGARDVWQWIKSRSVREQYSKSIFSDKDGDVRAQGANGSSAGNAHAVAAAGSSCWCCSAGSRTAERGGHGAPCRHQCEHG